MRIAIEIPDEHRAKLLELAARRGLKGVSGLVQEALDLYLKSIEREEAKVEDALSALGTFSHAEAKALTESAATMRFKWRES
jgi:HPt (histidine-containing phosphotransfer) domain-containing protein